MRRGKRIITNRIIGLAIALQTLVAATALADRIVLRNLDIISDKTVTTFDLDGVHLSDATTISWDRIEKGSVSESQQAAFDEMLAEFGSHLYRIRQRLSINDYRGLLPHAEAVYGSYTGRRGETAYMVFQALMWARLAVDQREAALQPYLECVECLRQAAADGQSLSVPGTRQLQVDLSSGFSLELPPVWFDAESARASLSGVGQIITGMVTPRPVAVRVYYTTLSVAAGELDKAEQTLTGMEGSPAWQAILGAQIHISRNQPDQALALLENEQAQYTDDLQPLILYWRGQARLASADEETREQGLLDLLRIAALHGRQQSELAGAGLYLAMQAVAQAGDTTGSISIRRELLDHYGQTWHAERLRREDRKAK